MLHPPGFGAQRPIDVPILIGAEGPKGLAVAAELGDGVFSAAIPQPDAAKVADWRALLCFGTVLDAGEELTSPRAIDAHRAWCGGLLPRDVRAGRRRGGRRTAGWAKLARGDRGLPRG